MITSILRSSIPRSAAAVVGSIILCAAFGGQPAHAQRADSRFTAPDAEPLDRRAAVTCPCLTGNQVDAWFQTLRQSVDLSSQRRLTGRTTKLLCANEPGFLTFDYLRRTEPRYSLYIDVSYKQRETQQPQARCLVEFSHKVGQLEQFRHEITPQQASACRTQILGSRVWRQFGCPSNQRSKDVLGQRGR